MKQVFAILCFTCIVKLGVGSIAEAKDASEVIEQRANASQDKAEDLEGSETSARLFNLGRLFPTYGSYPSYPSYPSYSAGAYPTTGGGYYPSSSAGGYYPTQASYPTGTNVLGSGYGGYPSRNFYPTPSYSQPGSSGYDYNSGGSYGGYSGYGGYGGYGGNGGIRQYNGYNNPQYNGKRNLGFGYYADTDRYGFYRSPSSQQLSVHRGYD